MHLDKLIAAGAPANVIKRLRDELEHAKGVLLAHGYIVLPGSALPALIHSLPFATQESRDMIDALRSRLSTIVDKVGALEAATATEAHAVIDWVEAETKLILAQIGLLRTIGYAPDPLPEADPEALPPANVNPFPIEGEHALSAEEQEQHDKDLADAAAQARADGTAVQGAHLINYPGMQPPANGLSLPANDTNHPRDELRNANDPTQKPDPNNAQAADPGGSASGLETSSLASLQSSDLASLHSSDLDALGTSQLDALTAAQLAGARPSLGMASQNQGSSSILGASGLPLSQPPAPAVPRDGPNQNQQEVAAVGAEPDAPLASLAAAEGKLNDAKPTPPPVDPKTTSSTGNDTQKNPVPGPAPLTGELGA